MVGRNVTLGITIIVAIGIAVCQWAFNPARNTGDPVAVTKNFIGYVELQQYDDARQFLAIPGASSGQIEAVLQRMHDQLDPTAVHVKLLQKQGDKATVQFMDEQNAVLQLQNQNGRWLILG